MRPVLAVKDVGAYDVVLLNSMLKIGFIEQTSRVPTILWVHEGSSMIWNNTSPVNKIANLFSKASKIIFQSRWQTEHVFRSFLYSLPNGRCSVIPNCIPDISPNEGLVTSKRSDGLTVSCVGGVNHRKRQIDLVNAAAMLRGKYNIKCSLVGSILDKCFYGDEWSHVFDGSSKWVELHGGVDRSVALNIVRDSDIFCLPSTDESFPLAPLEAAYLGVPVVLANLPVYQYIGWEDGVNCLMHKIGDHQELSRCIERIILDENLRQRLIINARQLATTHNSVAFLQSMTEIVLAQIP